MKWGETRDEGADRYVIRYQLMQLPAACRTIDVAKNIPPQPEVGTEYPEDS